MLQSVGVHRRGRTADVLAQLRCIHTRSYLLQVDLVSVGYRLPIDRKYGSSLMPTLRALCGALTDASAGMVL